MAYSMKTLAERWQCSERHIYNLIKSGKLKTFSISAVGEADAGRKGIRISEETVREWESGQAPSNTETATSPSDDRAAIGSPTGGTIRALVNAQG